MPAAKVNRSQITDAGLEELIGLTSLRHLGLRASRVTDQGLNDCLPDLQNVESLDLAYMDISDRALSGLSMLSSLTELNLRHTGISADGIVSLAEKHWQNLERLNVANTAIADSTLVELPEIFQPTHLNMKDTAVTDAGIRQLSDHRRLESLVLSCCEVSDDGVRSLEELPALKWLNLKSTSVTDDSFVWLSDTKLEHLGLSITQITDAGMPTVADFANLKSLDLTDTKVGNRGMRFLKDASDIETLYLEDSNVTGEGLSALAELPNLKTLSLSPRFQGDAMKSLCQLVKLRHLGIFDRTQVVDALQDRESLKTLLLAEPGDIAKGLKQLTGLRWLLILTKEPDIELLRSYREAVPACSVRFFTKADKARETFRAIARNF